MKTLDRWKFFVNAYVEDPERLVLVVYNHVLGAWSLPGCEVRPGETPEQACARTLFAECGVEAKSVLPLFEGNAGEDAYVMTFACAIGGMPRTMHEKAPVRACTPEEYLAQTPYKAYYGKLFALAQTRQLYCTVALRRTKGQWEREDHYTHGRDAHEAKRAFVVGEMQAINHGDLKVVETGLVIAYKVQDSQGIKLAV
jgi:ADP-ribose pyrophosphatase YjhB (NUDIX family)